MSSSGKTPSLNRQSLISRDERNESQMMASPLHSTAEHCMFGDLHDETASSEDYKMHHSLSEKLQMDSELTLDKPFSFPLALEGNTYRVQGPCFVRLPCQLELRLFSLP